ncbi:hypothetical protein ASPFODRAFT_206547 [Aspergillus luchuensis CBS 106.47]|uniref:Uncharacterized protein n=1 Tax=Aspergillus luchuensis (strain CBS 106.47) TaxID=1137211 RepID=A0A1M3TLR1_ASPLC|nr:hypothetical protein ASPFODRAFT_206547 [Aspergillus luchuensis CBS 106.47]
MTLVCRTVGEAEEVLQVLADNGLQVHLIFETWSNIVLAEQFLAHFDAVYYNSDGLAELFNEQDDPVTSLIAQVLRVARRAGCKVGIYGQALSDHSELSVISGRFVVVQRQVVAREQRRKWKKADGYGDNKCFE